MTTLTDDRRGTKLPSLSTCFFIGGGEIEAEGRNGTMDFALGPAHIEINNEHYRYEQYQAHTLWGLRRMNRREITKWRLGRLLGGRK